MALVSPVIFQIVGYQDSGKTSFIKKLVSELENQHITTATIKHHGHGGKPFFNEEKDSYQHLKAGAVASIVEGEGHLILQSEKIVWTLEEKMKLLSFFNPDVILIEGHKKEPYPKAVIIRRQEDLELLEKLENIKVVFYWQEIEVNSKLPYPAFSINDEKGVQWLIEFLQELTE